MAVAFAGTHSTTLPAPDAEMPAPLAPRPTASMEIMVPIDEVCEVSSSQSFLHTLLPDRPT